MGKAAPRTPEEWADYCAQHITGGYVAGGDKAKLYLRGVKRAADLGVVGVWREGDIICDVGCGNGRLAFGLLGAPITYYGVDVTREAIAFCQKAFAGYLHLHFAHIDVRNPRYNPDGKIAPLHARLPWPAAFADVVVCSSLFTHLGPFAAALRYLTECARVLKGGGVLYATFFTAPPNKPTNRARRTVYPRAKVLEALARDFVVRSARGGESRRKSDQFVVIAERRPRRDLSITSRYAVQPALGSE